MDDLSRERIYSGALDALIADRSVVGITTDDVARACEIFRPVYDATAGLDGRVSIEVSPAVATDAAATMLEVEALHAKVDRANVLIKIPATLEGLDAITEATARGISVNITLIFGLDRYRAVVQAYLAGLERATLAGIELDGIRSVASLFVSRVDVEIDSRLDALGTGDALAMKGRAGVANARLAYEIFEQEFASERATRLLALGAHRQRPLWASTGVKDPSLPDTLYVVELVAPNVVNTMPEKTLEAVFDHGEIRGNTIAGSYDDSRDVLGAIAALGISYDDVTETLEREALEKFTASWGQPSDTVEAALHSVASR